MTTSNSIFDFIPQRWPFLMVDTVVEADENSCTTEFTITDDSILIENGKLMACGIVEHMAQSASAHAGYMARQNGAETAPVGLIGEVKNFRLVRLPELKETLRTQIVLGLSVNGVTTVKATTCAGDEKIAEGTFKIVIED